MMKRFTGLFLLISLLGFLSLALASDFSPHQSGNDDSDDDNIYRIRARRSAEIYAKKLALEKGQENPSTLSESNDELNQKFPSWQKESYSSLSDDNDDSDNSDGGRHFKGIKEGDTSDDLSDAEPAVRARLKALEKSFKETFTQSEDFIDENVAFEKLKGMIPPNKKEHVLKLVEEAKNQKDEISGENMADELSYLIYGSDEKEKIGAITEVPIRESVLEFPNILEIEVSTPTIVTEETRINLDEL